MPQRRRTGRVGPDGWGQRVTLARHADRLARDSDTADLGLPTNLLESRSDRIGALDFQQSARTYVPRTAPATLHELFARIVFNICTSNTDDHARNHTAFWNGADLALAPAYDLCPQPRSGNEASQAMAIGHDGERRSKLSTCLDAAEVYLLTRAQAASIIDQQVTVINEQWAEASDAARLTTLERQRLWRRQILNPFISDDS